MPRKPATTKRTVTNEMGQSAKMREGKVVRSRNFYPAHYLNEVLAEDIKGIAANGDRLLKLRQESLKGLPLLSDERVPTDEAKKLHDEIAHALFAALGYYDLHTSLTEHEVKIELERTGRASRLIALKTEKRFLLKDDSELWLLLDTSPQVLRAECETALALPCTLAKPQDGEDSIPTWRHMVDAIFNSDQCNVSWIIVNTGVGLFLFEQNRWLEQDEAWLEADLFELWDLNSDEHAKLVDVLFGPRAFAISSPDSWHQLIATNAHKKATEVSRALRDTVRESVELLANEVLAQHLHKSLSARKGRDLEKAHEQELFARELFEQVLRVVYRMLFVLVAESQPQSKRALPIGAQAYQQGLSLEKLRDLESVQLVGEGASQGSFIWQTLKHQTELYFRGFNTAHRKLRDTEESTDALGFSFPHLGIRLFRPEDCPLLCEVNITDRTMQQVIRKLSLAQTGTGKAKRTHRVYYGSLSLNRLGEVYEGLLSLRPQILSERMYVLVRDPKEHAPRLVLPSKSKELEESSFELDEAGHKRVRQKGEFVLTPTGFERKLTASYYTPEELTQFLASEAVDCLLGKEQRAKSLEEVCTRIQKIENLKICEPAMGNGAFCNAVVNELSTRLSRFYVQRAELAESNPGKLKLQGNEKNTNLDYQKGRAKQQILRNGVYGVDLNPTAVELARVSLWLNALHKGCDLPFLDLKLRCGNSLVGAWVNKYRTSEGGIPHFLFPMPEMLDTHFDGKFLGDNKRPFLSAAEREALQTKRAEYAAFAKFRETRPDGKMGIRLKALSAKVDALYADHHSKRVKLQERISREFDASPAQRQEMADAFYLEDTAYNQLRGMMDLWCALWFWPHSELRSLPKAEDVLCAMEFFAETPLKYGAEEQEKQLMASGLKFLTVARRVTLKERFFHWDLEFPEVFQAGGFDLALGNPPWAPVRWEEGDFFDTLESGASSTEGDAGTRNKEYDSILSKTSGAEASYKDAWCNRNGHVSFLNASRTYEFKDSSVTNTYKFFYQRFLQVTRNSGIHAMIAQDGIITDNGNLSARPTFYAELERGFRFHNELQLFAEVDHHVQFFIWISRRGKEKVDFEFIDNLYHPDTVTRCRQESHLSPYRGMKNEKGNWELRGHPKRITHIDSGVLDQIGRLGQTEQGLEVALPVIHGDVELEILKKLGKHAQKLKFEETVTFSSLFNETNACRDGLIKKAPCHGKGISRSVLTGPNIFVANPAYKQPNRGCKNNLDYSEIDLTKIADDFFPHTLYEITDAGLKSPKYTQCSFSSGRDTSSYRLIGRAMVGVTSERTLSSAIFPPGVAHIHRQFSLTFLSRSELINTSGLFASLLLDFLSRCISGGEISQRVLRVFPRLNSAQLEHKLLPYLVARTLRLNCISSHYSILWQESWNLALLNTDIRSDFSPENQYKYLSSVWKRGTPLRKPHEREQALCEIDAIVAILFGISKQDLLDLYRSQFAVLQKNLQDLPNQVPDPAQFHFPRYQAMSDAYDACMEIVIGKNKPTRVA